MRLSKKQSIQLTILILVIFFTLSIISIKLNEEKSHSSVDVSASQNPLNGLSISDDAQIILNNFERSSMKNGKKEWEVIAKKGKIDPITKKASLDDTELSLFSKDKLVTLKAKNAKIDFEGNELSHAKLKNDIVLNFNNDLTLKTQKAYYNKKDGIVKTNSPVKIDTEFATITGDSMKVHIEDQKVIITNNVVTIITPKDSKKNDRKD